GPGSDPGQAAVTDGLRWRRAVAAAVGIGDPARPRVRCAYPGYGVHGSPLPRGAGIGLIWLARMVELERLDNALQYRLPGGNTLDLIQADKRPRQRRNFIGG
ncbi:MAG: hypothetical protein M3414_03075, partial [Pseudomonadota bacterium]|nr:hypothetical protein [Pseudomonadota bacterium]